MRRLRPTIIVFDVDGVLVDVRGSFQRSVLQTVAHFTGYRARPAEIHRWKDRPSYNDDWRLTTDWVRELGVPVTYDQVKRQFMRFYWGNGTGSGNVARERWLPPRGLFRRLGRRSELCVFTGRTRRELRHTFQRFQAARHFRQIVTMDDVARSKPHPDGLLKILAGRAPQAALYLGDNVDDALAARAAGVPFFGVLAADAERRRARGHRLRELGAVRVLPAVEDLERWLA